MNQSPTIALFAAAFIEAQAEIEAAPKNAANPHFGHRYADFAAVLGACRPALNKHGICIVQTPVPSQVGTLTLETVLLHKSGEWVSSLATVRLSKDDAQGYGSALSYLRRYSLAAMAGVASEDDDGEAAVGRKAPETPRQMPPARTVDPSTAQVKPSPSRPAAPTKPAPWTKAAAEKAETAINAAFAERHVQPSVAAKLIAAHLELDNHASLYAAGRDWCIALIREIQGGKIDANIAGKQAVA